MTIETELPAVKDLAPERVECLWWFLHIMSKSGGTTDASDTNWNWINAFCDDFEDDTFNLAIKLKLIRVTHDADYDTSTARLTGGGRALVAYFDKPPAESRCEELVKALETVTREELSRFIRDKAESHKGMLQPDFWPFLAVYLMEAFSIRVKGSDDLKELVGGGGGNERYRG